jgi:hypothetical protein
VCAVLCITIKIMFLHSTHSMNSMHCNSGVNIAMQDAFCPVVTCFDVLLHKSSHKELSQNFCCGVQM